MKPAKYPETTIIDQNLARGSRRSDTATYTGIRDNVRKAFAKANAVDAALLSANSKGACPDCNGLGVIYTHLAHPGATSEYRRLFVIGDRRSHVAIHLNRLSEIQGPPLLSASTSPPLWKAEPLTARIVYEYACWNVR